MVVLCEACSTRNSVSLDSQAVETTGKAICTTLLTLTHRAKGYHYYGQQYRDQLIETIRKESEQCDALQSFFLLHSSGGGTGSGLGSAVLGMLEEEYPDICRFAVSIMPAAEDGDVVTAAYNSLLTTQHLAEHADCVLPVDNRALLDLCARAVKTRQRASVTQALTDKKHPFAGMNNIIANTMANLTRCVSLDADSSSFDSSMRFDGPLNVDINEISVNLVPFPRLHFLTASLTPLSTTIEMQASSRRLDQLFSDAFTPGNQLVSGSTRRPTYDLSNNQGI